MKDKRRYVVFNRIAKSVYVVATLVALAVTPQLAEAKSKANPESVSGHSDRGGSAPKFSWIVGGRRCSGNAYPRSDGTYDCRAEDGSIVNGEGLLVPSGSGSSGGGGKK